MVRKITLPLAFLMSAILISCAKPNSAATGNVDQASENGSTAMPATPLPTPSPSTTAPQYATLAWEVSAHPERKLWSKFAFTVIEDEYQILDQAQDVKFFCPRYNSMTKTQRISFWGQLFVGIAKYESAWDPTSRMQESTFSENDSITGRPVWSEGLLQLSYGDIKSYPHIAPYCEFDWEYDKHFTNPKDPKKTILDPKKNLNCGIRIFAYQIKRYGKIVLSRNVYWAVLDEDGKYQKLAEISAITKSLDFCE